MKGSIWFPRRERGDHPHHARTHARRHTREAGRPTFATFPAFVRTTFARQLASHLLSPTHVTLWRVVVPRGAAEPPQPPPPAAADPLTHWSSYAPWANPPPPPPRHPGSSVLHHHHQPPPAKRALSESDDCDDAFSEESSKDQCPSPGEADSCQMLSRKKRRGIIEKRRRDRINNSLLELRRLVPSAYEKQGSAKLEKAEILQLTVDHLKVLHSKGLDALAYDPSKFAMDYHNIGFRECAAEVARYLVTVEGLDIQDPLRLRLMSHLQCFAAQRELASKQSSWYPGHGQAATPEGHLQHQNQHQNQHVSLDSTGNSSFDTSCETAASSPSVPSTPSAIPPTSSSQTTLTPLTPVSMSSSASNALYQHHSASNHHHQSQEQHQQSQQTPPYHQTHHHHHPHQAPGYHPNPNDITHQNYSPHHPNSTQVSSQMKPYRPWGAEVAY